MGIYSASSEVSSLETYLYRLTRYVLPRGVYTWRFMPLTRSPSDTTISFFVPSFASSTDFSDSWYSCSADVACVISYVVLFTCDLRCDSEKLSMDTMLGMHYPSIDTLCSLMLRTLCGPDARRSNILYGLFAICLAASDAIPAIWRVYTIT